ncbi:MAG: hypothetical protein M5U28_26695 [Sandaracinaceae bacterium]|nr:hypothetical protein [Sandaracinaceae bacterium]
MRVMALSLALSLALGCEREVPPPIPRVDASWADAAGLDARVRRDSGPPIPSVDGALEEEEWERAVTVTSDVATDRPGSTLTRLSALLLGDRLYVGVEGTLADGDSVVVYVDRDHGGPDGVADPSALADADGALDAAITQPSLDVSGVAVDLAWGPPACRTRPWGSTTPRAGATWRPIRARTRGSRRRTRRPCAARARARRRWISRRSARPRRAGSPSSRASRGRAAASSTRRSRRTTPSGPSACARCSPSREPAPTPDAGTPDAGTDAGGGGIVIDGVVAEPAWAAAAVHSADVAASGAFAGNALRTLRALRDGERVYVAIEATLTAGNAIAMYVDHDLGGADGLVSPTPLEDLAGMLDRALSKELFTGADLRVDFAWGTLATSRVGTATDDLMGWRDVRHRSVLVPRDRRGCSRRARAAPRRARPRSTSRRWERPRGPTSRSSCASWRPPRSASRTRRCRWTTPPRRRPRASSRCSPRPDGRRSRLDRCPRAAPCYPARDACGLPRGDRLAVGGERLRAGRARRRALGARRHPRGRSRADHGARARRGAAPAAGHAAQRGHRARGRAREAAARRGRGSVERGARVPHPHRGAEPGHLRRARERGGLRVRGAVPAGLGGGLARRAGRAFGSAQAGRGAARAHLVAELGAHARRGGLPLER